jgi:SRSO17 transposase
MASGTYRYLASNNLQLDVTTMLQRKYSRWDIETTFRDEKQYGGMESCQCWCDQAMVRHVALVMLTFVLMQRLRVTPTERVAHVKERCQLSIYQNKEQPPEPLRACPSEMRSSQAAIP